MTPLLVIMHNYRFDKTSININVTHTGVGTIGCDVMNPILVYVWFDIEDYVTKESDDLPLVAFRLLEKYAVPVTCKLVAEKIRRLEENGRSDVISAMSRRDVGYHMDTHSQHPTLYEYVADLDVLSGSKEFLAREGAGFEKIKQAFSRNPSCFGHPGPTWAPHVYPALPKMDISVYLDETPILNLHNQPYWYCGILNLNGANRNCIYFDYTFEKESGLEILKRRFKKIHDALKKEGGGAVSFIWHLHTAINKQFWDEVNFAYGRNTRKEDYKRPPAQPSSITERAWKNYDELVRYMSSFEDVKFITAGEAPKIYRRQDVNINRQQLEKVVKRFCRSNSYMKIGSDFISPAEAFYAVVRAISDYATGSLPEQITVREPLGPMAPFRSVGRKKLVTRDLIAAAKTTLGFMERENCLPTSTNVGGYAQLSPHDFLATACGLLRVAICGRQLPEWFNLSTSKPPNRQYIRPAEFRKACKWKVLPHNFKAPKILEQIELQAWTLKPATVAEP